MLAQSSDTRRVTGAHYVCTLVRVIGCADLFLSFAPQPAGDELANGVGLDSVVCCFLCVLDRRFGRRLMHVPAWIESSFGDGRAPRPNARRRVCRQCCIVCEWIRHACVKERMLHGRIVLWIGAHAGRTQAASS